MRQVLLVLLGLLVGAVGSVLGMPYNRDVAAATAEMISTKSNPPPDYKAKKVILETFTSTETIVGNCCHMLHYSIKEGMGGRSYAIAARGKTGTWNKDHKNAKYHFNADGSISDRTIIPFFRDVLGCTTRTWWGGNVPESSSEIVSEVTLQPGDWVAIMWRSPSTFGEHGHVAMVTGTNPLTIGDQRGVRPFDRAVSGVTIEELNVVRMPSVIAGCRRPVYWYESDSTFKYTWVVAHKYICCWHENLGGEAPWSDNPSAYCVLSWEENRGTTWDTLKSPLMNFAGCTDVQLRWSEVSNLNPDRGIARVVASTDGGVTWPYTVRSGPDGETTVSLPWATDQRAVRLAWTYVGPVQENRSWCIDEVRLWAKPERQHDAVASEVMRIPAVLSPGRTVRPLVWAWNPGLHDESLGVTLSVPGLYAETAQVPLYSASDSVVHFPAMSPPVGSYTATAVAIIDGDENRANDTVRFSFSVVADTWVRRFPVYCGHPCIGLGMTVSDSNTIFCSPSYLKHFAKYLITEDLWKTRKKSPMQLNGGVADGGSGFVYGLRATNTKTLYRYSIAQNTWAQMTDAPCKVGRGGRIVFGGGNYMYVLRGDRKRDFLRYSKVANSWDYRAQVPGSIHYGAALAWDGNNYIYALRGDDKRDFYRYSISADQWTTLASVPQDVDDGGALAFDPTTGRLYALCGNASYHHFAYTPASNTWASRQSPPRPVRDGGALVYLDHELFASLGSNSGNDFWRFAPPIGGDADGGPEPPDAVTGPAALRRLDPRDRDLVGGRDDVVAIADKYWPKYSPDGLWIVCVAYDSARDCMALYKMPAKGGTAVPLTADSVSYDKPVWSAAGGHIAASGDSGLYVVAVQTGQSTRVAAGCADEPRWLAGDSWLLYERWDETKGGHVIHRVRSDGTGDSCLVDGSDYCQPQPLPDSGLITARQKGEVTQLHLAGVEPARWLTSDYCENACPSVSPDGTRLTWQKLDESGYWQIYVLTLASVTEQRLTNGTGNCEYPVFSPDGSYIAYTKWPAETDDGAGSQICVVSSDSGPEIALNGPDAVRERPCWSPDCSEIAFEAVIEADGDGKEARSHRTIASVATGLQYRAGRKAGGVPPTFILHQNVPNPFARVTAIRYGVPATARVHLGIYDVGGRLVRRLVSAEQRPGNYTAVWDGTDEHARRVSNGTYFYILKSDGRVARKRMLLVR